MQIDIGPLSIRPFHIVVGTLALALIIVLLLVLVMAPRESADTQGEGQIDERVSSWATADRLVVPDDFSSLEFEWVPYRGRRTIWTDEQIAEHWNDPDEVGLEVLRGLLEAEVRALLEEAR